MENAILKRLLVDAMLDVSTLKEMLEKKLLTPSIRRAAVDWQMKERGRSQGRACVLVRMDPRV